MYTIAGNLCRDYYKKKRETPLEEPVINKVFDLSKNHEEAVVNKITIEWALKKLPDELSEIVILYYFQGLKLKEIACTLQISLPLVKYRIKSAKSQLERMLREEEGI